MSNNAPITYHTQQLFNELNALLTRHAIKPAATDTDYFDLLRCSATPIGKSLLDQLINKEAVPNGHFAYLLSLIKEHNIQVTDLPEKAPNAFTSDDLNRWCLACYQALLAQPGCLSSKTHLNLAKLLVLNDQNSRTAKLIRKKVIDIEKRYAYDEETAIKLVANLFTLSFTEDKVLFSQLIDALKKIPLEKEKNLKDFLLLYCGLIDGDQKKSFKNFVQQFCHFYLNPELFDTGQFIISYNELNEIYKEDKTRKTWFKITVHLLLPIFIAAVIIMPIFGLIPALASLAIAVTLLASACYQTNQMDKEFVAERKNLGSFINDLSFYKERKLSPEISPPTQYSSQ